MEDKTKAKVDEYVKCVKSYSDKIVEYVKGWNVKKVVLIVLGVVLVLNILSTMTNSRFDSLKAELDQIKASSATQAANVADAVNAADAIKNEIVQIKKDLDSMQKSAGELKAFTQNLARTEYNIFKARLDQMNKDVEEMNKDVEEMGKMISK